MAGVRVATTRWGGCVVVVVVVVVPLVLVVVIPGLLYPGDGLVVVVVKGMRAAGVLWNARPNDGGEGDLRE